MLMAESIRRPPGPSGLPLVGYLPFVMRDPIQFYLEMGLRHGPIAHTFLGPHSLYAINDPELIEEALLGKHAQCIKDNVARQLIPLLGRGLLTNEGADWRKQRKLSSPPLQPNRVASYAATMVEATERALADFVDGELRDVQRDIMELTLEVVGKTLLGVSTRSETARVARVLEVAQGFLEGRLYSWSRLLPVSVPTPSALKFRRSVRELDTLVQRIIDDCRAQGDAADHLLARLMRARTEDGEGMTEKQLRDEVVTLMLAGHETTALLLTYTVHLLATHPKERAQLRDEIDSVVGKRPVSFQDLPRLTFLDAVVREALRLYPPAYAFGREAVEPFELAGYTIPRGSTLIFSPFAMHRSPRFFAEPLRFDPNRWLTDLRSKLPRFAYFPFGGGPRVCIGSHFAAMEAALILATLTQRVELTLEGQPTLEHSPAITLRLRGKLHMRVHRRT